VCVTQIYESMKSYSDKALIWRVYLWVYCNCSLYLCVLKVCVAQIY